MKEQPVSYSFVTHRTRAPKAARSRWRILAHLGDALGRQRASHKFGVPPALRRLVASRGPPLLGARLLLLQQLPAAFNTRSASRLVSSGLERKILEGLLWRAIDEIDWE